MNTYDIVRLYKQFETSDKRQKDYYNNTPKMQRFYDYLTTIISTLSVLQVLIKSNDTAIKENTDGVTLDEYQLNNISKAANYISIVNKKRQAAAANN